MKRFIVAFIAAYVFMFAWGWLLNGVLLKDVYAETPNLWRSQSEMMSLFHWIIIGQALLIFAFVAIYASGFAGGGVMAGIRLGFLLEIAAIGYRMPAEWEPHAAMWLSWPRREGSSFPDSFDRVMPALRAMVEALIESEQVCINICNGAHEAEAREVLRGLAMERISFHLVPTNEPWCRDHGPIFLTREIDPKLAVVDWNYNAWGNKYR